MEEKKCCCEPVAGADMEPSEEMISEQNMDSCCRIRHRDEKEMKELIHRLNRVEGQIRGIRAMVEEERYCVDILTQVTAAKSALDGFSRILLNQHIHTCVVDKLHHGDEEVVDELCGIIHKLMR